MSYLIFDDIDNGLTYNQNEASNRNCDGIFTKYWFVSFINQTQNKIALNIENSLPGGRLGPGVTLVENLEGNFEFEPEEE